MSSFQIQRFPMVNTDSTDGRIRQQDFRHDSAWPFGALLLIRHGSTRANELHQYCGRSDASLSVRGRSEAEAVQQLLRKDDVLPAFEYSTPCDFSLDPLLFASPLNRCLETANILWPHSNVQVIEGFAETDFGAWEGKTWEDLKDDPLYQRWLDEGYGSDLAPPRGESSRQVITRITQSWQDLLLQVASVADHQFRLVCVVTHGGVIMNLLTLLTQQPDHFYQWQCRPCEGFLIKAGDRASGEVRP